MARAPRVSVTAGGRVRGRTSPAGFAVADAVLILSALSLLAVLLAPWFLHSRFVDRVDRTLAAVEGVRLAVVEHREEEGRWPARAAPGRIPPGLGPYLGEGAAFGGDGYALQIEHWSAVEGPPPRPEVGEGPVPADSTVSQTPRVVPVVGLRVHTSEPELLAALLAAYGPTDSFVQDTVWTLIFPRRSSPWEEAAATAGTPRGSTAPTALPPPGRLAVALPSRPVTAGRTR